MKSKAIKKSTKLTLAIVALLIMLSIALAFFLTRRNAEVESERLDTLQQNMLEELSARRGDYNENKIVLSGTSHSKAQQLAEAIGAKLRITADGSFATLTLTDGRTIADIVANDEYKDYLEVFGIDYAANVSDIYIADENSSYRNPEFPDSGYISKDELGDYLGFMNIGNVWSYGYNGAGVTVAVIDTGIDTDHPEFTGRISEYSYNATEDKIVKDYVLENGGYDWSLVEDEQGHGTAVAGALGASMDGVGMTGIAPNVTIIVIKAECDEKGRFKSTSDLVFGLYYAIERDVNVVNMSFGSDSNPFAEATQLAYDSDVICVAAAGNDNTAQLTYPAADPNVIGVGALADGSWELASYSNYGENTDVVAPGTVYTAKNGGGYTTMNGTSFASPLVAGMISLFIQNNYYTTFDAVCEVLYASSYDLGELGFDWIYGYGAVDVNAFILEERGTLTYDMMTDEIEDQDGLFIRNHTIQNMLEPERLYAVFDGWYYDPHYVEEFVYYEDRVVSDITLYAKWVSEDDEIPFTYRELDDGTIEITSYRGRRRFISVPEYIDGKLVTSIGANAFAGETRLREVNLPFGINNIGAGAFYGCTNLTRIDIPENVIKIDNYAFYSCVRLAYINFGQHPEITYIGDGAFAQCASLIGFNVPANVTYLNGSAFFGATAIRAFTVDKNNTAFLADGGVLFNATKSTLVAYPANRTEAYTVPSGVNTIGTCAFGFTRADSVDLGEVTSIGASAFQNSGLTSIVIPDTVVSVGASCFAYSTYLSEVKLSSSMTEIEESTFRETGLTSVVIPKNITKIGIEAFRECVALATVVFEEGSRLRIIGSGSFFICAIKSLQLPESLVTIDGSAFSKNITLHSVVFAENSNLRTIGASAFSDSVSLGSIIFPESLESIGDFAFSDSALTGTISIPKNLSYFGEGAFASCHNLVGFSVDKSNVHYNSIDGVAYTEDGTTLVAYPAGNTNYSYYILNGTKKIGGAAFYGAKYVTDVQFNSELEEIDDYAFSNATSLNAPTMPIGLMKIGRMAFEYTDNLYTVYFDSEAIISRLSYESFAYSGLQYLTIPKNVSTMSQGVFKGCDRLYNITFAENSKLESISAYMFDGCSNLQKITFGAGSSLTSIQAHALEGMSKLRSIDFGDAKITNIDNFAFRFCENLTSVNLPNTVTNIGRYAFYYCKSLSEISIPSSVEHIGSYAFIGTNNCEIFFESETLPTHLDEDWDRGIKGYYLGVLDVVENGDFTYAVLSGGNISILKYNGNDEYVDLHSFDLGNIITIGGQAFAFKNIRHITLPDGLITIQAEAFFGSELEEIHIPSSVEFIGREAFYNTPIRTLTFGENSNLKVIEQSAFENTKSLGAVTLPASLTQIGTAAFRRSALNTVIFTDGIKISEISNECFAFSGLTSVSIPDSVVKVGDAAFRNCVSLESFDYGEQKLWLGANAFYDSGLKSFYVSKNLYVIEEFALASLNECEAFIVDEENEYYKGANGLILLENGRKLVMVPAGMQGSLTIPESVEKIGFGSFEATELSEILFPASGNILCIANRAFFGAENITEIVIPESVISIDYYAFAYATNLKKIIFDGDSRLTGIYEGAFYGCSALSDILLPDSIVEISDFAFYGCRSLTKLPVSETTGLKGIHSYAFAYTGLTELVVPEDVIDIDDYSFLGAKLKSVVISNKKELVLRIGIGAFEDCKELEYIELPFIGASYEDYEISWFGYIFGAGAPEANQTYIPESLKNVKINGSVTFVGNNAFYGITSIDSLVLPDTVDTLYLYAFDKSSVAYEINRPLKIRNNHFYVGEPIITSYHVGKGIGGNLVLSNTITILDSAAFSDCTSLKNITIPDSVTSISSFSFSHCTSLASVTIPGSVTSIGYRAFFCCTNLSSATILNGVTEIGTEAFYNCRSLENIVIPEGITKIGDQAFVLCDIAAVIIPDSVETIGRMAFSHCEKLSYVRLGKGLKIINLDAFRQCENLIKVQNDSDLPIDFNNWSSYGNITVQAKILIDKEGNTLYRGETSDESYLETADGLLFKVQGDNYTLTDYVGCEETVTFPLNINGNSYTINADRGFNHVIIPEGFLSINSNAFKYCSIKSITLPDSLESIGEGAFLGCTGLTSIAIPDSVTTIGNYAFWNCTSLTSIAIPDSVTSIGFSAFDSCYSLSNLYIGNGVTSIGNHAFACCSELTHITIPNSIEIIADGLFQDCKNLTSVIIGGGVKRIGSYAFSGCTNLVNINITENVTQIGSFAFKDCLNLISITIPNSVTAVGSGAFSGCDADIIVGDKNTKFKLINGILYDENVTYIIYVPSSVTDVVIPKTVTNITSAFANKINIRTVTFEEDSALTIIGDKAFSNCQGLINIDLPSNLKEIQTSAFMNCTSLMGITIPDSVTTVGHEVFRNCTNLRLVTIGDNVTSIGNYAFEGCTALSSVTIPDSVTSIGGNAFDNCSTLNNVKLGNGLTSIAEQAFYNCTSLMGVTIPDSVTSIDKNAFYGCSSLTNVKIGNGVTSIGYQAFRYCTRLTSITIPDSVTNIGTSAFEDCTSLTSVTISDNITSIDFFAFAGCNSLTRVTIPDSVTSIGNYAFEGCTGLTSITIPDSVTSIGNYAFSGCTSLTSITIGNSVTSIGSSAFEDCHSLSLVVNNSDLPMTLDNYTNYGYITESVKLLIDKTGNKNYKDGITDLIDTSDGFRFLIENGEYKLVAYLGEQETVTLPLNINGNEYKITNIRGVKNVIIPDGFTSVDSYAFNNCNSLMSVTIGNSVTSIGSHAFYNCTSLTSITFPDSVTSIGNDAFYGCTNLTSVTIGDSVTSIGYYAFYNCTSLTSMIIPDSVTSIGDYAFYNCTSLTSVIIPDSVTSIGYKAFFGTAYYNDTSNWSADGALYIDNHLIAIDKSLKEYRLPQNILTISNRAFEECYSLKHLEIEGKYSDLNTLSNLETLVIRNLPAEYMIENYFRNHYLVPSTLKSIVLSGDKNISKQTFLNLTGVTIYVEGLEKDLRWDDNFPGWNNGNNVVYGDEWINVTFYDHLGTLISNNIFTTHQVIRVPYLEVEGNAMYSYVVEGFDIDGDGIADTIPATSSVDINAVAVVKQVLNTYTVNFYDGENVLYSFELPYGNTVTLPDDPSKMGYDFLGWEGYTEGMLVEDNVNIYSLWSHHGDGHVYGEAVTILPTCEGEGYDKHVCDICGEWYGDNVVPAIGHNYSETVVAPTCENEGYTLHSCDCGHNYKDNFTEAFGHTYGKWKNIADAGCVTDGSRERTCSVCAHKDIEIIPATGHSYKAKIIREATCEKEGSVRYTCNCGSKVTETIPMTAHNYEKQYASKSFLQWLIELLLDIFYGYEGDNGYYFKCKDCGHVATEDEVKLSASASVMGVCEHTLGDWVVVQPATCIDYEVMGRYCSLCNEVVEAKIGNVFTEHTPANAVVENRVEPDCITDGKYDNVVYCSVCEAELGRETITIDKLGHNFDTEWTIDVKPTCTTVGSKSHHCSRCDATEDVTEIPANGHSFGEWYETKAPTCTATGIDEHKCSVCGHTETKVTDALGHNPDNAVVENRVEPDCTTDGHYDSVVYCSVCNAELRRETVVIDKLGHDYKAVVTSPTCTEKGYTTHTCSRCSDTYVDTYVNELGHSYGDWYEIKAPNCTGTGTDEHKCSICGHTETKVTDALGHKPANAVVEKRVEPDCTTDGKYDSVVYCSVCNTELSRETVTIDKLGHNYSTEWTIDLAPTCTEVGSKSHHCLICDEKSDVTEIPANGHDYDEWFVVTLPTCTETGLNRRDCKVCDHYETEVVKDNGHTSANAVVENRVEPDCTTDGKYDNVVYCSVCNAELSRENIAIDKLGHNFDTEWTIDLAPTCTEVGSKSHHCSRCDEKSDVTEIPANGHDYDEWFVVTLPTCTETGLNRRDCKVCGHYETEVVKDNGHTSANAVVENRVEPDCTTDGKYDSVVYCSVCNAELSRETIVIDKLGHNFDTEWTVEVEPTCTTVGGKSHHCLRCDEKSDVTEIPANGHSFGEWYETKAPTCTGTGIDEHKCSVCGYTETKVTDALGHKPANAVVENRVESDCTTDGKYDSVVYCSVCNAELSRETITIDKLGHNFDTEWTVDVEPTCTEVGSKSHHCLRCDEKSDVTEIPANGHSFGEWYETKAPTCTETGLNRRDCKVCGHYETEVVKSNGHKPDNAVVENRVEPDCTTDGKYDSVVYCFVCNAELSRETVAIDKLGHNFSSEWTVDVESTCTTVGSKSYHCTRCDEKSDVTEIPANGHSFGEWLVVTLPTCTETGLNRRDCKVCGHYETEVVKANGHNPANAVVENRVEPDCTTDGKYDNVVYCSVCNAELIRETITIDKLGHKPNGAVMENRVEPDCITDGKYDNVVYCSVCEAELSRESITIDKLGHNFDTEWTIDVKPTCTTVGSKSHHCSRCDATEDVTEIPANGHDYDEWFVVTLPTCTETGVNRRECKVCDHYETEVVKANGHTPANAVVENRVEPDCITDGKYDNVVYCSVCEAELSRETITIDKLGHDFESEWTVDIEATCTTVGSKSRHCTRCDAKADVTEISNGGHNFTIYVSDNNATYTDDGTKTAKCENCDQIDTVTDVGSALGLAKKFKDEVALINDADTYETAYVKMRNALITYQTLSDEEKSEVSAEYQLLTDRINSYNNIINEANTEHSKATELAFAPLAAMSFTFMVALWYLLKKKIFG